MRLGIVLAVLAMALPAVAAERRPALVPWPAEISFGSGELAVGADFHIALAGRPDARVERAARRLESRLRRQVGLPPPVGVGRVGLEIVCEGPARSALPALGMDESYTLEVTAERAVFRAPEPWGVLRGMETFLQLVGPGSEGFRVPAVVVRDRPRFPWCGLLIDSGRHYRFLDAFLGEMAALFPDPHQAPRATTRAQGEPSQVGRSLTRRRRLP